jgi:hypothetical protein
MSLYFDDLLGDIIHCGLGNLVMEVQEKEDYFHSLSDSEKLIYRQELLTKKKDLLLKHIAWLDK